MDHVTRDIICYTISKNYNVMGGNKYLQWIDVLWSFCEGSNTVQKYKQQYMEMSEQQSYSDKGNYLPNDHVKLFLDISVYVGRQIYMVS